MNTDSTYKISKEFKGVIKQRIKWDDVKRFAFNKMSSTNFNPIALVDFTIIDEATGETFPLSQIFL